MSEVTGITRITQTWMNTANNHLLTALAIPEYNVFSKDRSHTAGGGVMLYVSENLNVSRLHKDINTYDSLYIELITEMTNMIVGVLYRPRKQCEKIILHYTKEIVSSLK